MLTTADEVWAALALGGVSSVGLLVGAIAGSFSRIPHQAIAMAMSVGAGLLLAGVSLKVATDAIQVAGPLTTSLSLLLGAAMFSASNALLAQFGAAWLRSPDYFPRTSPATGARASPGSRYTRKESA